ncbi:hypothetical protein TTHERM_00013240 (macronuclear) [Tetrahymena thermophila SB210]|uniref:Uncharacterized protein n=1 Tax=Tetrahymena thermophila (strain SB210) TaxID=312017 RepID=Q22RR4_TETTS|nr:hypothetical protein TTHERM_00013240 [Tetrahymena thermophila SB210]EAR88058.1 hypothetical protein TTHERM_00013240 [Tetrahymena thermophila SB210]|eukprot:XP_001008303.1 hypothetical protein TTHERM_00013240 [Tetrahymena thermophila SB210]
MTELIQLDGLKFSSENLSELGGKQGVGSFFQCCCYVDPSKWATEQQIHKAIYTILQSRNMFPKRSHEVMLKVEQCRSQSEIIFQTPNRNSFPTSQSRLPTQRILNQDLERYLSDPNPFINQDHFLQESQKETTCDVTSQDILSCIDQNNNNLNNNANIHLFYQMAMNQQNQNDQRGLNNQMNDQSGLNNQISNSSDQQHQNGLIVQNQVAFLDIQQQDTNYQEEQKENQQPSSFSSSQQNKLPPLNNLNVNNENNQMFQQQNFNLEQSQINQNQENLSWQTDEINEKIDESLKNQSFQSLIVGKDNIQKKIGEEQEKEKTKPNNFIQDIQINKPAAQDDIEAKREEGEEKEENKSNNSIQDILIKKLVEQDNIETKIEEGEENKENESKNNVQTIQNNNSFNDEESEIYCQIHQNNTQRSSNKLKNTDDSRNQGESKLQESNLSDSDIKYEEQKDHIQDIHQMKTVDMQQEKEQVYNEQTNYQIQMLRKEIKLEKQKNHQLLKEKKKDKHELSILKSSATQYIMENSELKQQVIELKNEVIELKKELAQTEVANFNEDILSQNIAQFELMQQKEKSSDIYKDLYIKELEQTKQQNREEILFLKNQMLEILKQIQQSQQK